jgi:hypothetical protein
VAQVFVFLRIRGQGSELVDLVLLGSQCLDEVDGRGELAQFLIESAAAAWIMIDRLVDQAEEVGVAVLEGGDAVLHDLEEVRGELLVGVTWSSMIRRGRRRSSGRWRGKTL